MIDKQLIEFYTRFKFGEDNFHNLMHKRIRSVLLIASYYDAYILEQDGRLSEQIVGEYRQLDLSMSPMITTMMPSEDIDAALDENEFDLVVMMMRLDAKEVFNIAGRIKDRDPALPIVLLLNRESYNMALFRRSDIGLFRDFFLWMGDARLFVAMIKSIEDERNADYDTVNGNVRVILLVENSTYQYSNVLPNLYAEIMTQTQRLILYENNDVNKRLLMRTRPKVILVHNYDDAIEMYKKYREFLLCVMSNVNMKRGDKFDPKAGLRLLRRIRSENPNLPLLLMSVDRANLKYADQLHAAFLDKNSQRFNIKMRRFITHFLGFGPFMFRLENGHEISRASSLEEFENQLRTIPNESLLFHSRQNHFSTWLTAHGYYHVAQEILTITPDDFGSTDELRSYLVNVFDDIRFKRNRGKVINFDVESLDTGDRIVLLSQGSLGGKGRGLAFLNALLTTLNLEKEYNKVSITIPKTVIVGTDEFDRFVEDNGIHETALNATSEDVVRIFKNGNLSRKMMDRLDLFLRKAVYPLAVRSSGLLEDSQSQPFAGVYDTYMLPNNDPDIGVRLEQLASAIKMVYSSPFRKDQRNYIESINYKLQEEKMAVVIQEVAGKEYIEGVHFPLISGVAQSHNFYPVYTEPEDGVAHIAVGLGRIVVEGEKTFQYCPAKPGIDVLRIEDIVESSQDEFYGLDLSQKAFDVCLGEDATLRRLTISSKLKESVFLPVTSVYDYQRKQFLDGKYIQGPRVITYRNPIRYGDFPLSGIISRILDLGEAALGVPVEIEFAVDLQGRRGKPVFTLLQIRPLFVQKDALEINLDQLDRDRLIVLSTQALGNGSIEGVHDIVYLDVNKFDVTRTVEMKDELEKINQLLKEQDRNYVLIGPGRWGSSDRFLGIPIKWTHIDMAKVIIEAGLPNFQVEASQGSHFFHNLVALNIGYFNVPYRSGESFIDWERIGRCDVERSWNYFKLIHREKPFRVMMDGRNRRGIVSLGE